MSLHKVNLHACYDPRQGNDGLPRGWVSPTSGVRPHGDKRASTRGQTPHSKNIHPRETARGLTSPRRLYFLRGLTAELRSAREKPGASLPVRSASAYVRGLADSRGSETRKNVAPSVRAGYLDAPPFQGRRPDTLIGIGHDVRGLASRGWKSFDERPDPSF